MAAPRVAIVGGGLSGLAAGVELKEKGYAVELFERARLLGGRATSFALEGVEVDNGQHIFLACCTEFLRFVQRIGMSDALWLQDRFEVEVFSDRGRSRLRASDMPAPWQLLSSFARYGELGPLDKMRLSAAILALVRHANDLQGTFLQWLRRHGQSQAALESFWEPFMVPALNVPLDRMDAAEAAFVLSTAFLHDRGGGRIGYSRVPLLRLMEKAALRLDALHLAQAVHSIQPRGRSVWMQTAAGEHTFDAIVLTVPPRALARMLLETAEFGLRDLDRYQSEPIMDVHLWHDAGKLDFDFAAVLRSPVQWIFQKAEGYLCCSLSAAGFDLTRPSGEVAARTWQQIRDRVPALRAASLLRFGVTRNPEGTYLPAEGVQRPGPRTNFPNVAVAGAWTATGWPDTMESAVRSGIAAAEVIAE